MTDALQLWHGRIGNLGHLDLSYAQCPICAQLFRHPKWGQLECGSSGNGRSSTRSFWAALSATAGSQYRRLAPVVHCRLGLQFIVAAFGLAIVRGNRVRKLVGADGDEW
ncbi:hypothetical protein CYLTODRAFT_427322 [Cylindrobasidium torrendii FP15055 ss-10]|uniref:Uncharacterized protein n=1 Tax=Cylindrobasidium torrendii FP15055 ss-10 TaxID=1314674 RepID=A0A0D7AVD8_9AGAR|nr:hypothetical protein CYLTODRAFT_427322 [Cylindrobasidium torrendii FP15055 ss-10]